MTRTLTSKDKTLLDRMAASAITEALADMLTRQKNAVFCVAGGRSVKGVFENLKNSEISWEKVHVFMADERRVPITDPESNFKLANDTFLKELADLGKLPKENVHPFIVKEDESAGVADYNKELEKTGGRCDLVLLSAGEDGHIGSLYPNHPSIKDESKQYIKVENSPKLPAERMSMSRHMIENSTFAFLLFCGEGKKDAYKRFNDTKLTEINCPAKTVLKAHKSYVFTDIQ